VSSTAKVTASGARHLPTSKIVILGQMVLNLSLSIWLYEEYLNNQYLRIYVNGFFQAQGFILAILAVVAAMGSVGSLLFFRNKPVGKTVETVSIETKIVPLSTGAKKNLEPGSAFHAAVAALKADLASRPVVLGSLPVSTSPEPKTTSTPRMEAGMMKISELSRPSLLATSLRADQSRPPLSVEAGLFLKTEGHGVSVSAQPSNIPGPTPAQAPTTVITGVVPVQKKKEPEPPAGEKSSS